ASNPGHRRHELVASFRGERYDGGLGTARRRQHRQAFLLDGPPEPAFTLFPYTTLFRSRRGGGHGADGRRSQPAAVLQGRGRRRRSEEHTSELQSLAYLVCRLLLEKKKDDTRQTYSGGWR